MVIQDVGLQLNTAYVSGRVESRFIDKSKILDVVIHEGISLWQVVFYMAVLLDDSERDSMVVIFRVCFHV